jgi:hypothetical protein
MAKETGLGDLLFVDGVDISGDVGQVSQLGFPSGVLDVTAINASGMERIHSHVDGVIVFNAFFNDAAGQAFPTLKTKPATDRIVSYFHGSGIGEMAASLVAKQVDFDWERGADGSLVGSITAQGNKYGLEMGGGGGTTIAADGQLTAGKRTDSGATNGASLDCGIAGGTALGCAAVLHVFALTGDDVTITIESSSDDGSGDAFASVAALAFTQVTAAGAAERKATALGASVERYLRVVSAGTFSSVTFAVSHTRHLYAV